MAFFLKFSQKFAFLAVLYPLSALIATTAHGEGAGDGIKMKYDVYAMGMKVYKISLDMNITEKEYAAQVAVRAKGFIKFFSNGKVDISTRGVVGAKNVKPVAYVMASDSKGKKRNVHVKWVKGANPKTSRNFKLNEWRRGQIAKYMRPDVSSPLTFIFRQVARLPSKPCSGTERVYTGKIVYEYSFKPLGRKVFTEDDGGDFRGQALKCSLSMKPLAGLSAEKMQKVKKNPYPPYTIWYAPVAGKKKTRLIPIAAQGEMKGQPFEMKLRKGTISGQEINARAVALK